MDIKQILGTFRLIAQQTVGGKLSKAPNGVPNVILSDARKTVPGYPYIAMDFYELASTQGSDPQREFDCDTGTETLYFRKRFAVTYTCYGGTLESDEGRNAISIINELSKYFYTPNVRNTLKDRVTCSVKEILPIDSRPVKLSDGFISSATLTLEVDTIDKLTVGENIIFDSLEIDLNTEEKIITINVPEDYDGNN